MRNERGWNQLITALEGETIDRSAVIELYHDLYDDEDLVSAVKSIVDRGFGVDTDTALNRLLDLACSGPRPSNKARFQMLILSLRIAGPQTLIKNFGPHGRLNVDVEDMNNHAITTISLPFSDPENVEVTSCVEFMNLMKGCNAVHEAFVRDYSKIDPTILGFVLDVDWVNEAAAKHKDTPTEAQLCDPSVASFAVRKLRFPREAGPSILSSIHRLGDARLLEIASNNVVRKCGLVGRAQSRSRRGQFLEDYQAALQNRGYMPDQVEQALEQFKGSKLMRTVFRVDDEPGYTS
ncbi:hypothetical protein ACYPKM_05375 [Pseudomonas aeruginosa]